MRKARYMFVLLSFLLGALFPHQAYSIKMKDLKPQSGQDYQTIPEEKFQEIFHQYVCKELAKKESDVLLSRFRVTGNGPVPSGKVDIKIIQKSMRGSGGNVRLTAAVCVDGNVKERVTLSSWVDVFNDIVCTSRDLKRGEIIKRDDVCLDRRNISNLSQNILTDIHRVIGLALRHNVNAETCLKEGMVERPPVVTRGDMVTILAESGDLRITVPGTVMETGHLGDVVRVENAMSKKTIFAKVINSSTVVVDF